MNTVQRARALRKKSTWVERSLWRALRNRRFAEYKFRRQFPCGGYYLDFFCPEARLNIEVDGIGHGFPGQQAQDRLRDQYLLSQGIAVKRVWNSQWKLDRRTVMHNIWLLLQERSPHPKNQLPEKPPQPRE